MSFVPNLIIHNANVITMDDHQPVVQAVACFQGRIVAIGGDHEILPLAGAGTKVMNMHGATVIPGLNDGHNHMLEVGIKMTRIVLDDVTSLGEIRDLIATAARTGL